MMTHSVRVVVASATRESDLAPDLDLFDFVDAKLHLEEALGASVDLVELRALRASMRGRVPRQAAARRGHAG